MYVYINFAATPVHCNRLNLSLNLRVVSELLLLLVDQSLVAYKRARSLLLHRHTFPPKQLGPLSF
jgi:hypothetical protein